MRQEKVKFSNALSSVIIDKYLEITANMVVGIIGFIILLVSFTMAENTFLITFLALFFSAAALYTFYKRTVEKKPVISLIFKRFRSNKSFRKMYRQVRHSEILMSKFFAHSKKALLIAFSMSFTCYFLMFFEFFFLLRAFGITVSFTQIFMVVAIVGISYMLPIPAA
jgi:uncharacterized protein (TIRG00374 family)